MKGSIYLPDLPDRKKQEKLIKGLYSAEKAGSFDGECELIPDDYADQPCTESATYKLNINGHYVGDVQTEEGKSFKENASAIMDATREVRKELAMTMDIGPKGPGGSAPPSAPGGTAPGTVQQTSAGTRGSTDTGNQGH